jgi:hypothetical protein
MTALAPISEKIGKLIRMLGSDRDSEVLAAVQAIRRTLQGAGRNFHVLAEAVEKANGSLSEAEMRKLYEAGFRGWPARGREFAAGRILQRRRRVRLARDGAVVPAAQRPAVAERGRIRQRYGIAHSLAKSDRETREMVAQHLLPAQREGVNERSHTR